MLEAYHRARTSPGGDRLDRQGVGAIEPAAVAVLAGADTHDLADIGLVLTNLTHGVIGRFADGRLEVTEILPTLDRAVYRLTANNEPDAPGATARRAQRLGENADRG